MRLHELAYACGLYAAFADFDKSLKRFRSVANPDLDLGNAKHRVALLVWLNSWGCRQFAKAYHTMASNSLLQWGRRHIEQLPHDRLGLIELPGTALDATAKAYGNLVERRASIRAGRTGASVVTFGPTGAAKVLYALRPNAALPWDDPIREELGYDGSPQSYCQFLIAVQKHVRSLVEEAARLGIKATKIPAAVGRTGSSLPKLVDEYYWVTITKRCPPPTEDQLARWVGWARYFSK